MHHFKINGEIGLDYNVSNLERELSIAKGADLYIDIDSIGGDVHTGINIFTQLRRYANEHNAKITTRSSGFVASIATIIFLGGDNRIVNEFMQPFVHEPRFSWTDATTADDFRKDANELEQVRDLLADFYSKNTNLSKAEALELMANDTWMSADECLRIGFATEIEKLSRRDIQIVAKLKSKINLKSNNKMSKSNLSWFERATNIIARRKVKAQLELADVNGDAVVFPDLEADSTPGVGDTVIVNGDANYTGAVETEEYVFTVDAGKVSEIVDKTEIENDEIVQELVEIIEDLEEELEKAQAQLKEEKRLRNVIAGRDPKATRNGKDSKETTDKASAAIERIKNRKKK